MTTTKPLYEGKAKRLFATEDEQILKVEYKNDLTAFNGEKTVSQLGKGKLNNAISALIFEQLTEAGIPNHFVKKISETEQLVKRSKLIPIEVVVRNVAAGSLVKRLGLTEGETLKTSIVEYYYKDDALKDPLISEDHIFLLDLISEQGLKQIRELAIKINDELTKLFQQCKLRLIDFKLEFGFFNGEIVLIDEISPDTCRLWDEASDEKLDKDVFRQDLGNVVEAYEEVYHRLEKAILK